jgi:hypothetical protein
MSGGTTVSGSVHSPSTSALMPVSRLYLQTIFEWTEAGSEVTGKLARYVVLRRSKEGRITGLNREIEGGPSTSSRCPATERYSSIIHWGPRISQIKARRVVRHRLAQRYAAT